MFGLIRVPHAWRDRREAFWHITCTCGYEWVTDDAPHGGFTTNQATGCPKCGNVGGLVGSIPFHSAYRTNRPATMEDVAKGLTIITKMEKTKPKKRSK